MTEKTFDAVVLGAGSAGEVCAGRLADGDLSVAIVEGELIGGECSYWACMPSKALLRPGELLAEVERVPGASQAITGELDVHAVLKRRDEIISNRDDSGQVPWLEERGITLVRGEGQLDGEGRVRVGSSILRAQKAVVIATGTTASLPPIDGLKEAEPWDNRQGTTSNKVPRSLVVLGGGPVGAELAQAWSTLGSQVTLIEAEGRLLTSEEPFAGEQVAEALVERHGVDVRTASRVVGVRGKGQGVEVDLEGGGSLGAEQILVAIGRSPRTEGIGLETVGITPDGYLEVDDQLRVEGSDWLYAIGDVNGRALLTHMGKYQARIAADHILGKEVRATEDRTGSPRVTFTDPQVAAVGRTLADAKKAGIKARAVDVPTSGTAGASFHGRDAAGTTRLVVDEDKGIVVGATFVGPETADFLHAATIAVVGQVPLDQLWHAVPAFPTRSEVWLKLLESYGL